MKNGIYRILVILTVIASVIIPNKATVFASEVNSGEPYVRWGFNEIRRRTLYESGLDLEIVNWKKGARIGFHIYDSKGKMVYDYDGLIVMINGTSTNKNVWQGSYYGSAENRMSLDFTVGQRGDVVCHNILKDSDVYILKTFLTTEDGQVIYLNDLYLDMTVTNIDLNMEVTTKETGALGDREVWVECELDYYSGFGYMFYQQIAKNAATGSGGGGAFSSESRVVSGYTVYENIWLDSETRQAKSAADRGASYTQQPLDFDIILENSYVYAISNTSVSGDTASLTYNLARNFKNEVIEKKMMMSRSVSNQTATSATPTYLYNTTDPGLSIKFDLAALDSITDQASAVAAVKAQSASLTTEQKQSPTGIDLMTLYAEQAVSNAAAKEVSGGIVVNPENVQELQKTAADTRAAVESALTGAGIAPQREINENVAFSTKDAANVTITVESSAANTTADNVRIDTPEYSIAIPKEMIVENTADSPLVITITENNSVAMLDGEGSAFIAAAKGKSYDVKFNKPVKENVKVSLPVPDGDSNFMAVFDEGGYAVGGKYNPTTAKMDVKVNKTGTYIVKENKKDFSDIQSKSAEMQEAIRVLSSKGIINGTSPTEFSPDSTITRAQIAQLITKTLSKLDANANGGFTDVKTSDWFYGAAGSAKAHGIMSGTSETTFSPNVNISKDQIVAVSARVLRNEMNYNNPSNVSSMLNKYSDGSSVPDWAKTDVALATQLNLVVQRTDGSFSPAITMTRGDAAIILYRMFMKIW